jgi:hypothetical protein
VTRDAKLTNASKPRWRIGAHPINVEFSELPIRCLVFVSSGRSLREVNRLSRPKMSYPRAAVSEHNDVAHPFAIPFALTHLAGIGVFWFGVTYQSIVICLVLTGCACSRLVPDIIATSRISPTRQAVYFSSCSRSWRKLGTEKRTMVGSQTSPSSSPIGY